MVTKCHLRVSKETSEGILEHVNAHLQVNTASTCCNSTKDPGTDILDFVTLPIDHSATDLATYERSSVRDVYYFPNQR